MTVWRRLLGRKFGPLSDRARARLASARADALLRWADRILDAHTLEDVMPR